MQRFRSSIHLQFDLYDPNLIKRYILTPAHCVVFRGILQGVVNDNGKHAHLLVGPYGTGKSLLSTIICQLLSRKFNNDWTSRLYNQAKFLDLELASLLESVKNAPKYIPIIINGRTRDLSKNVNQAIHRALREADLNFAIPSEATAILRTVERWKNLYPEVYRTFIKYLEEQGIEEEKWYHKIDAYNDEYIQKFIEFYPSVTAGSTWAYNYEGDFIGNLENLSKKLADLELGMFIIYDEFGGFLQQLNRESVIPNMQALQTLAEFVDRVDNTLLLLISHKHIRQYAINNQESILVEFKKIEGRFQQYILENDTGTYLQLAQEVISHNPYLKKVETDYLETEESLLRFSLFGEFTTRQISEVILNSLFPIHPVAIALLPHLSNIFGQNERTLFSFLTDDVPYSLSEHARKQKGYYYADQLFDYFQLDLVDYKNRSSLGLYHKVMPYVDGQRSLQARIIKFLTIWSETKLTQKQPLTTSFIAFSLGITEFEANNELALLSESKIVLYNKMREQWELFNGSSIDVETLINEKLKTTKLTLEETISIMERHLPISYVLPHDYNDKVDMIRYADIRFISIKDLLESNSNDIPNDDRVWLIVYEADDEIIQSEEVMQQIDDRYLVAFPSFSIEFLHPTIMRYKILEQFLQDKELLSLDPRLKNELVYLQDEISQQIRDFVNKYFDYKNLNWQCGLQKVSITNQNQLEKLISKRMEEKYNKTPIIRNEAFNRNRISAIQRRALIDVIDRLISQPEKPYLGIEGYGPNYLIYATVLKNNDYRIDENGNIRANERLLDLRHRLLEHLNQYPEGDFFEIIEIMRESPYGIRLPVIPLLLVALLRDKWENLLFYSNDMMISHLSGSTVIEMVENAKLFKYRYYEWSSQELAKLEEVRERMGLVEESSTNFIYASEALLEWLRSFPKFAQISFQYSDDTLRIRDYIRATEVDPYTNMKKIIQNVDLLITAKTEIETFMERNKSWLEREILKITDQPSFDSFFEKINKSQSDAIVKNSKLITLAKPSDHENVVDLMAEQLVGVNRSEWSDATQELFIKQVKYEWELLMGVSETATTTVNEFDNELPLSKKAHTIYANVKNILKYAGRDVPTQELKQLLYKLIQEL